jgi:Zn-dependent M28 family amino/carboxypeptidase
MNRSKFIVLATLLLVGCKSAKIPSSTFAQPIEVKNVIPLSETQEILTTLSSDEMEGREFGTAGMEKAAAWVEDYMKKAGIKPFFSYNYQDTVTINGRKTANVVGLIGSKDDAKEYILLGAHLDHIGKAASGPDLIYNGANDDASGVTAVLQIAQQLQKNRPEANVIVALFTAEESGLLGSAYLAKRLKGLQVKIKYMLNFEMIGKAMTIGANKVYITGYNKSNLAAVMNELAGNTFATYLPEENQYQLFMRSDNYSFYEIYKVPCHTISTFDFKNYPYYHELKDEASQLDIEHMNKIINLSTTIIEKMIESNKEIKIN